VLAMLLMAAAPAAAQEQHPKTTIMGGYMFAQDKPWDENLPWGWIISASQLLGGRASVIGEISAGYGEYGETRFSIQRWAFLGGIRIQGGEGLRPFIQGMAGLSRQAGEVGIQDGFLMQAGGGVDLYLNERFSLRGYGDYRMLYELDAYYNQFRFGGGIVYNIRK
jgi:hypothetical protein